ncbi:transglycosylase domain-containing protein [Petrotoga sp. 9PWA.NaAc.5.4]|uniref:transglycosylase domain-containing protein n=1 Tax=Petrotoga sp. 9PWA.NaAc.5.4 TaxID=1434328 RepID=UPI000EFB78DA
MNKVNKIIKAINIEKNISKEEILVTYLENVYFGRSNFGIYAATENYLGTSVSVLNKAQYFFLAEIIALPKIFRKNLV